MKKYNIPVSYEVYGVVTVEAEDDKDLLEKLNNVGYINQMRLPNNPQYLSGSYRIDYEGIASHNQDFYK